VAPGLTLTVKSSLDPHINESEDDLNCYLLFMVTLLFISLCLIVGLVQTYTLVINY
jgi:hypothetical protein